VGHWEGDTLVIVASDFVAGSWFDRSGNFHSDALKVTERYSAMGPNAINYQATIEDPNATVCYEHDGRYDRRTGPGQQGYRRR
jgi:hypothetical protein